MPTINSKRGAIKTGPAAALSATASAARDYAVWFAGSTVSFTNMQGMYGGIAQASEGFGTMHMLRECAGHFDAVELIFANTSQTYELHIAGAAVAVSDSLTDKRRDDLFASASTAPTVTFGGQVRGVVPRRDPATMGNGPALLVSDKIPLSSVDRTDVIGGLPLLLARVVFDGRKSVTVTGPNQTDTGGASYWIRGGSAWSDGTANKIFTTRLWGDFLRTPLAGSWAEPTDGSTHNSSGSFCSIFGLRLWTRNKALTIVFTGDSIVSCDFGNQVDRGFGWANWAVQKSSTLARPIEYCNLGIASQTSDTYTNFASRFVRLLRPSHVVHWGHTPNDTTIGVGTPAALQTQLDGLTASMNRVISAASETGAQFAVLNGVPRNATGSMTNSYYDATNGQLISRYKSSLLSSGFPALDTNSIVADPANQTRWQTTAAGFAADYTSDQVHPTIDARTAMRAPVKSFVDLLRDQALPIPRRAGS